MSYFQEINSFHLDSYKYLFFDIFYKNEKVYIIMPVYEKNGIDPNTLTVQILDDTGSFLYLSLSDEIKQLQNEASQILMYNCPNYFGKEVHIKVTYKTITRHYKMKHIQKSEKSTLGITTLFLDDYKFFDIFYNYYKSQGVDNFYMYYNGKTDRDIKKALLKPGVILIDWRFKYRNYSNCAYKQHAQPGQLNHALYRFGKDNDKHLIYCDLDEILYIPLTTLKKYIISKPLINVFGFCNVWAKLEIDEDEKFFKNPIKNLPKKFIRTNEKEMPYGKRSKNIIKTSEIRNMGIHNINGFENGLQRKQSENHLLYHFYRWTLRKRIYMKEETLCLPVTIDF